MDLRDVLNYNEQYESARVEVKSILLSILEAGEITQSDNDALDSLVDKYNENYNTIKALGSEFQEQQYRDRLDALDQDKLSADPNAILNVLTQGGRDCSIGIDSQGRLIIDDKAVPKLKLVELEVEKIVADLIEVGELVATKATIEDLKATNAEIENLKADIGDFQDLTAVKADIQLLKTNVANINTAVIGKADITDLNATNANITALQSNVANITTLIGGNLTMDNIQSLILTTDKVTVADAFIKDAMIDSLSANKIKTGSIDTNLVKIQSADGSMTLNGSLQQFKDKDGNVRIQIGKDASGNFTFALYDKTGNGQLINENGITASAISDGLIVNDMVADNANISGSKLDINSVITQINGSTTTIDSSKIYFDDKGQTLEVAFNQLSTKVDLIEGVDGDLGSALEQISANTTQLNVQQGQINTLISNTTITKENGQVVQLKDEFSTIEQDVDSITAKISSLETNDSTVNSKISTIEQTLESVSTVVSATETKINNLEIGGKNLLLKTDIAKTVTGNNTANQCTNLYPLSNSKLDLDGKKLTVSFKYKVTNYTGGKFKVQSYSKVYHNWGNIIPTGDGEFTFKGTITAPTGFKENSGIQIRMDDFVGNIEISKMKLEVGNTATDWTPAPEDIQSQIDTHASQISTTSQKVSTIETNLGSITQRVASTETTTATLTEKINDLKIGGENLADGTTDTIQSVEWSTKYGTPVSNEILLSDHNLTDGEKLTLSLIIKSATTEVAASLGFFDSTKVKSDKFVEGEFVDSGTSVVTATIPKGFDIVKCYIRKKDNTTEATVEYSKVKIEKGTTPTDWCPSIADMKGMIDDAAKMELPDGTPIYIKEKVAETSVTLDAITSSVSSLETHFDENGTVTNLTQQVSTLEQFASQFTMEFFQKVENADQGVTELLNYIHFDADGITIGQETYPIRLQLTKDRIKFLDSDDEQVAYFSEGKLYVNNAEILNTFKIGNYGFMSTANGGLTIGALS